MKKIVCIAVGLPVLAFVLVYAQPVSYPPVVSPANQTGRYVWVSETNSLPKFDLDFPGGTPEQLVSAIEKATDQPLNAVIPDDSRDLKIPSFLVKNVTVAELFRGLMSASKIAGHYDEFDPSTGGISGTEHVSTYGFQTDGIPAENSVWVFTWDKQPIQLPPLKIEAPTVCEFFQLSPYLDAGYKVDDITTAAETAWKMLGVTNSPAIRYHENTKVLIAVGKQDQVDLIGDVLKRLSLGKAKDKPADNQ